MLSDLHQALRRLEAADTSQFKFGREARYSCLLCRDYGWVTILHPDVIAEAVATDGDGVKNWARTCVVLCTCEAVEDLPTHFSSRLGNRAGEPIPVYGERRWHIRADDPDAKAKAATFEQFRYSEFD